MSARSPRRRRPAEAGTTAIEFAMCLPILLMMVVGIFQFGWTQHTQSTIRFALSRAARTLMLNPDATEGQLQTIVTNQLKDTTSATVDISLVKTDTAQGRIATLSANYTSQFGIPTLAAFSIPYQVSVVTALPTI